MKSYVWNLSRKIFNFCQSVIISYEISRINKHRICSLYIPISVKLISGLVNSTCRFLGILYKIDTYLYLQNFHNFVFKGYDGWILFNFPYFVGTDLETFLSMLIVRLREYKIIPVSYLRIHKFIIFFPKNIFWLIGPTYLSIFCHHIDVKMRDRIGHFSMGGLGWIDLEWCLERKISFHPL